MPLNEVVAFGVAAALSAVLVWAAIADVVWRRIPNMAVLCVLALFPPWCFLALQVSLGSALAAGALSFAVGYAMYHFKAMGAGDVKLFAALALFTGLDALPLLALATSLAGGVMAIFSLATRPRRAVLMFWFRGSGDFGRGIPYGVAIAIGAAFTFWGALTGALPPELLRPALTGG